jgi:RNA polymerase sigma-70 factor, ECF subfamily
VSGTRSAESATDAAVARTFRDEWGRCIATVARVTGRLDVAEEAVQEAFAAALRTWSSSGVPRNPGAWITTTARNRALDRLRREARRGDKEAAALRELEAAGTRPAEELHPVEDDQLRLVFTCCHPALSAQAQVGLTLRLVCGLSTAQIARAFLEPEATVAQRLSRAKRRIRDARIPLRVPSPEELPDRLPLVLACVHLTYREGYAATGTEQLIRADLCDEGRRLGALLARLLPDEPEVLGLYALLLLQDARRGARTSAAGDLVLLPDQDRTAWDRSVIAQGLAVLDRAAALRRPGPYQLQAAIAAEHARAPTWEATDWGTIVALYTALARRAPSPVVELNRAVAVAQLEGPAAGLAILDRIGDDPRLTRSHLLPATRGDLLRRLGRHDEARTAFQQAHELAPTGAERRFLAGRLAEVET